MKSKKSHSITLTTLARMYWSCGARGGNVSDRQRVRLFLMELKKTSRHRHTLYSSLKKHGWRRKRRISPALLSIIQSRLGEPDEIEDG